jgi:Ca2+:H+ antiporter
MPTTASGAIDHPHHKHGIEPHFEETTISEEKVSDEKIPNSSTGTSDTVVPSSPEQPEVRHRKRSNFLSKFSRKGHEEEEDEEDKKPKQKFTMMSQIRATIFNSWINVLLIAAPVGIAVKYAHVDPIAVFVINFIAIVPLAALLSYATEEIALRTGETLGGLLNASFGYGNSMNALPRIY